MMQPTSSELEAQAKRLRTVFWVIGLATLGLIFDGYDLVVYGTVVSTFLRDPSHIGVVTPATAGVLGSYALVGVLFGALLAGTVGDVLGSFLIGVNLALDSIFYVLAGIGVVGIVLTLLVPMSHSSYEGPSSLKRVR